MNHTRSKIKVVGADGTCQDSKTYKNPPKTANEILEQLRACGFVGDLQETTGDSLIGGDFLDDNQEYALKVAPHGPRPSSGSFTHPSAEEGPTDNTSEKVSKLLQSPLQQPPPFANLASYVAAALPTKLPVPEAMYHRLRTQDRALADVIEPLSASGAEALATLIGSALDSEEFQPTDKITIGGHVDQLMYRIWSCMGRYDKARGVRLQRKRNSNEDSATMKPFRPDLLVSCKGALLFKGEDKTDIRQMDEAMSDLTKKLKNWGVAVHGKVEYLLSYACAGSQLQLCALQGHGQQAVRVGYPYEINTLQGKLDLIIAVVHLYAILKAQVQQLPISFLQLGHTRTTSFSSN